MKIIFRSFVSFFIILILSVIYMSTVGVETSKFNKQIGYAIKNIHEDLEIELQDVKIKLDPLNFEIHAKTVGPKLKIKDKIVELESIKTQIILSSFLNDDFSLKNLNIVTRSLQINNLLSFTRNIKNTSELYILKKIIRKGFLIGDIYLEFDKKGNVKENYNIKGVVKDAQIKFLKKYNFNKINFIFDFEKKEFELTDLKLFFNKTFLSSEKITIKNDNDKFLINGAIKNQNLSLKDKLIIDFVKDYFPKLNFIDLNLNSKNNFSLRVDKKFKIDQFQFSSEIDLKKIKLKNNLKLEKFFPNIKKEIDLNDHLINLNYNNNELSINGKGKIHLQEKEDQIKYRFLKQKNSIKFNLNCIIDKNIILISPLSYKKEPETKAEINLDASYITDEKIIIKSFLYSEKKNKIEIKKLFLNKDFKITRVDELNLKYFDQDFIENQIKVSRDKNNVYEIIGSKLNANNFIENLINNKKENSKIFDSTFNFTTKIDEVFLNKEYVIEDLRGNIDLENNEITNAELVAFFSKNEKLKFTIKTNELEKVTTLFLDQAEPIVKRFKFIKGYSGGSLDFFSSKKGNKSFSNLKIYNFRLKELPILTKLLTLASLQGIADILSGEGITFDEFEMNFENQNRLTTINEMYAIGPAISILMEGYVEKNELISLKGSLVPATTLNNVIGNLPVLGKILVGSKTGEGVFGVSFKIKGPPGRLETSVNPIKTLTPRFITRTLEKIKKN